MGGLKASYFKRIYIGFKLDFLFSLFIPLLIMVLLVTTDYRLRATGVDPDLFSLDLIGDSGGIMIKLAFILLILRYVLKALCALSIISGLGEMEANSRYIRYSRLLYSLYSLANAIMLITKIIGLSFFGKEISFIEASSFAVRTIIFALFAFATHFLLKGYESIMNSIGQQPDKIITRHADMVYSAVVFIYIGVIVMTIFSIESAIALLIMSLAAIMVGILFLLVQINILKYTHRIIDIITAISD